VLDISPFYSSYYSRKYNMGAIKNTPAGKEGEGKQVECKRKVERGCALQINGNRSNNRIVFTSKFFIAKKDLKQLFYSELVIYSSN
jgi:hypothetical protein